MTFELQYAGEGLFRKRAGLEWVEPILFARARQLGWDEKTNIAFFDSDGLALGGHVFHS